MCKQGLLTQTLRTTIHLWKMEAKLQTSECWRSITSITRIRSLLSCEGSRHQSVHTLIPPSLKFTVVIIIIIIVLVLLIVYVIRFLCASEISAVLSAKIDTECHTVLRRAKTICARLFLQAPSSSYSMFLLFNNNLGPLHSPGNHGRNL